MFDKQRAGRPLTIMCVLWLLVQRVLLWLGAAVCAILMIAAAIKTEMPGPLICGTFIMFPGLCMVVALCETKYGILDLLALFKRSNAKKYCHVFQFFSFGSMPFHAVGSFLACFGYGPMLAKKAKKYENEVCAGHASMLAVTLPMSSTERGRIVVGRNFKTEWPRELDLSGQMFYWGIEIVRYRTGIGGVNNASILDGTLVRLVDSVGTVSDVCSLAEAVHFFYFNPSEGVIEALSALRTQKPARRERLKVVNV